MMAGGLGFEPRLSESESEVLPLNYPPLTQVSGHVLVGVLGFEPRDGGTKNRCLTTWRHPIIGTQYAVDHGY